MMLYASYARIRNSYLPAKNAVLSVPKVTTSADIVAYSLFGDQWSFEVQLSTLISDSSDKHRSGWSKSSMRFRCSGLMWVDYND